MTTYAVGDIHGHLDKLVAAHRLIAADRRRNGTDAAPVVHLGDLVDRGPASAGVIDYLSGGIARGEAWVVLMGNHDRLFLDFLADGVLSGGRLPDAWLRPAIGGLDTLASYGLAPGRAGVEEIRAEARRAVPPQHRRFLEGLPLWHRHEDALFVHAGIRPGLPLSRQVEEDLIWIRTPFLTDRRDHGMLVVHGHTPAERVEHHGNRLAVDTGAGFGRALSAVVVEARRAWLLTEDGRLPLEPGG